MIYSVLVSPITFRHPSVLLKMATTINEMAKKRFRLGVGTGWLEVEHEVFGINFPDLKTRFEMLDEALEYLTQAMFGENNGFNGKYYQLDSVPILPSAKGEVPIIIGGCLLYTSDAADDIPRVDLGGRRIIKKKIFSSRRRHTR